MTHTANTSGRRSPAVAMASGRALAGLVLGLTLALPAQPVRADALDELREALGKLRGAMPLRATVTARINAAVREDSDRARVESGSASLVMEDGPQGLRLVYSPDVLARSSAERAAQRRDGKAPTPTSTAMARLDVGELAGMAQAAPELLRWLEVARLRGERRDTWSGAPARVLSLDLAIDRESKHVRSASSTVDVWIDAQEQLRQIARASRNTAMERPSSRLSRCFWRKVMGISAWPFGGGLVACASRRYATTLPRADLMAERCALPSRRRCFDP